MSLTLTVLGTATPYPLPGRACSGYLLSAGQTQVWMDAGPGSLANLQRHTSPDRLSAIWLSHLHADHAADLLSAYYALAFADLRAPAPIPVYAPAGCAQRLAGFFAQPTPDFLNTVFDIRELHDGHQIKIGGLQLTSRAVHHDIEGFGLRAEYEGRTIVYSGDSGPCTALDELAVDADLLLCEAEATSWPADSPQWHHTPEDAGALARRARVRQLIVTHVGPFLTPEEATSRAAAVFGGPTLTAREGDAYSAGSSEVTVVEVPQWQGSAARTARRLETGAALLAELIPAADRVRLPPLDRPGTALDGVNNADVLLKTLTAARSALSGTTGPVVTVGGDCGVELAPVEAAQRQYGAHLAVVWFDAHGDLNTPASSPSGAFHGMVLRTLLGDGPAELLPSRALSPDQVVLAGVRALDPGESDYVQRHGIRRLSVAELAEPAPLIEAVAATGADTVYVHIDLDVLDPRSFASVGTPEPDGLSPDRLAASVAALARHFSVAGLGITEYEPAEPADQAMLSSLIPTLVNAAFASA
jgi:arginase family enzyme/ribonuclease BN (tRNA processing enzyme)